MKIFLSEEEKNRLIIFRNHWFYMMQENIFRREQSEKDIIGFLIGLENDLKFLKDYFNKGYKFNSVGTPILFKIEEVKFKISIMTNLKEYFLSIKDRWNRIDISRLPKEYQ